MRKVNRSLGKWRYVAFFLAGTLVPVLDQLSKTWIRTHLVVGGSLYEAGTFRIVRLNNSGAAFGLFQGQSPALAAIAVAGIILVLAYFLVIYRRFPVFDVPMGNLALGLILGGTIGNLIDRLARGHVTDFIDFGFWPAFNVADSVVTAGVIILGYGLLRSARLKEYPDGREV